MDDKKTIDANTNTNPNISIINAGNLKKKPHNITIKNFNPNEPKIRQSQILYSDKQNYRRYKTKTEPKLFSKITIDEEDDLVAKIRKEFGITADNKKTNYSEVNTSGATYTKDPEPYNDYISDISRNEGEDIVGQVLNDIISKIELDNKEDYEEEDEDDDEEEITQEKKPKSKKNKNKNRFFPIISKETSRLMTEMKKRNLLLPRGKIPLKPALIEARNRYMGEKIAEYDAKK